MMTTQAMSTYHHGTTMKQETGRTTSPTVLQSAQDCAASPVATSYSSSCSPLPSDPLYGHVPHHHMAPTSGTNAPHSPQPIMSVAPVPVRSASWAAGSPEPLPSNSVPAVITTQELSPSSSYPMVGYSKAQAKHTKTGQVPVKKKHNAKSGSRANDNSKGGNTVTARRQKRLERNRESARLSRRRRKQYLEVLEERVSHLSIEMDQGRREHAKKAIEAVLKKRQEYLDASPKAENLPMLDGTLSRTSEELSVVSTFHTQQLKSFSLPPHAKFILWLTLQGDAYYRGGRAASERLSAARIGERMLHSGNDRATPVNSMWPLFCNEVGLSYEQEERVRTFQKALLQEHSTWVDRHTARASTLTMQSFHDSLNAVGTSLNQREKANTKTLTADQRLKFMVWANKNADRVKAKVEKKRQENATPPTPERFSIAPSHHLAANLYILNHRLQKVLAALPQKRSLVNPAFLKKLSRRPSFESLGQQKDALSRDSSFPSSGSLKRSASSLSMGGEEQEKAQTQVSPEDGQEAAAATVEKELGFVKEIIPPPVVPAVLPVPAPPVPLPPAPSAQPTYRHTYQTQPTATVSNPSVQHVAHHPAPIAAHPHAATQPVSQPVQSYQHVAQPAPAPYGHPQQTHYQHPTTHTYAPPPQAAAAPPNHQMDHFNYSTLAPAPQPSTSQPPVAAPAPTHTRKSSFLPPHLNVVPEEMFQPGDGSDDFFMSLIDDEDWAIGAGVDMDTTL